MTKAQTRRAAREILACYIDWHASRQAGAAPDPAVLVALMADCPVIAPADLPPHLAAEMAAALADLAAGFAWELCQRAGLHLRASWFDFSTDDTLPSDTPEAGS